MIKLSEMKNDEWVIVSGKGEEPDEVTEAFMIRENKELYVGKEMYTAKEYKPHINAREVISWISEYIECNDEEICEDWSIECSKEDENEMQKIIDKILKGSSLSYTYGEEIENDLVNG